MVFWLQSDEQVIRYRHVCAITLAIGTTINKEGRAHYEISLICLRVLPIGTRTWLVALMSKSQSYPDTYVPNLIRNWRIKDMVETIMIFLGDFILISAYGPSWECSLISSNSNIKKELHQLEIEGNQFSILKTEQRRSQTKRSDEQENFKDTNDSKFKFLYQLW